MLANETPEIEPGVAGEPAASDSGVAAMEAWESMFANVVPSEKRRAGGSGTLNGEPMSEAGVGKVEYGGVGTSPGGVMSEG